LADRPFRILRPTPIYAERLANADDRNVPTIRAPLKTDVAARRQRTVERPWIEQVIFPRCRDWAPGDRDVDPSGKTLAKHDRRGDRGVNVSSVTIGTSSGLTYDI